MHNTHLFTLLSLLILFSPLGASDKERSLVSFMLHSQFPFNSFNTAEKQRDIASLIVQSQLKDALKSGSYSGYKKTVFAVVTGSMMANSQQELLNSRANAGFLGAIPLMLFSKTRHIGFGMGVVAGGLKIDAARQLPNIDIDHVVGSFNMIEEMLTEHEQKWEVPSLPQNPSDLI